MRKTSTLLPSTKSDDYDAHACRASHNFNGPSSNVVNFLKSFARSYRTIKGLDSQIAGMIAN